MEFFTESETNNNSEPIMTKKENNANSKKQANKRTKKIQLDFTQCMITNKEKQSTKDKRKEKNRTQRIELEHLGTKKQLTPNPVKRNGKRKRIIGKQLIRKQNKTEVQEMERKKMGLLHGI